MKISVTKINTFTDCPRKYWYSYEQFIETPKSVGFYFGSAIHSGLENYYTGLDPMDGVREALFGEKKSVKEFAKEGIDLLKLEAEAQRIFDLYKDKAPHFEPILIEHFFEVPLTHPETKETLPATLTGKIDLITGEGVLIDHKTASGSDTGFFKAKNTIQANGYAYAYWQKFGKLPQYFMFNTIIKGNSRREPRFEQKIMRPTIGDLCYFFDVCKEIVGSLVRRETRDYYNRSSCRFCPYKSICQYVKK